LVLPYPHCESAQLDTSKIDPGHTLNTHATVLVEAEAVLIAEYDGHVTEPETLTVKVPEHWEEPKQP
jgi:hypothetical protein